MERRVALFIASRVGFFRERACINSPVDRFCACEGANEIFDVKGVVGRRLVDTGEGVQVSRPVELKWMLASGWGPRVSLSHRGILAICLDYGEDVQLTDLNTDRQVEVRVGASTLAGFYDDKVLVLTRFKPLREAKAERVLDGRGVSAFREIEGTSDVSPFTDVSLLNDRRTLYYTTTDGRMWAFNVDTRVNGMVDVGRRVNNIASLTGIDCGVSAVFHGDDCCTYTLSRDGAVTKVGGGQSSWLTAVFPSSSTPEDIGGAVLKHGNRLTRRGKEVDARRLPGLDWSYSVVRVYRDTCLTFDSSRNSWVLFRLAVP